MAKILQVCNTDFYLNKFLKPFILELLEDGHEVHTACHTTEQFNAIDDARIKHHNVSFPSAPSPLGFWRSIRQLKQLIRREQFDCVNSHNRNASIAARVAAWRCKTPHNIYTAHGFYFHDDQSKLSHWLTVRLESALARITSDTLSQSQEDIDFMTARGLIKPERIHWIGNGIDTEHFKPVTDKAPRRQALGLPSDGPLIAAVGRLVRGKGFQDLIHALAELLKTEPRAHLVLIGGNIAQDIDPFAREMADLIEKLQLHTHITLTGLVDNVPDYLACADVYVLPSYREGISRSMLEALACEVPVIATEIRGCRELFGSEFRPWLYPARDVQQLHQRLRTICSEPQSLPDPETLFQRVQNDYTERAYSQRQSALISSIMERT